MANKVSKTITRTVTVSDLTPQELASIFAQMNNLKQAQFFDALAEESKDWPGMGWQGQAHWIADELTPRAKAIIRDLGNWFPEQEHELPSTFGVAA